MRNAATLFVPAAAISLLFATGCSSFVPFTYELRAGHRLTDDEVKNLQFYTSHQITLRRELQSQDRQVTPGHTLRLISGKSVEEVVIPAKTPGVAMRVSDQTISVSFVSGTSLDFTVRPGGAYDTGDLFRPFAVAAPPRRSPAPSLLGQTFAEPPPGQGPVKVKVVGGGGYSPPAGSSLGGNYFLTVEPSGQIGFAGVMWEGVEDTTRAHLLIDADKLEETEEKRTVLPGMRLGN